MFAPGKFLLFLLFYDTVYYFVSEPSCRLRGLPIGPTVHWSDSIKHQTPEIRFIICRRCFVHIDEIGIFVEIGNSKPTRNWNWSVYK